MGKTIRRRRHERKTDYKARLALLKSEKPRLVVRKTNRYIIAQIVQSDIAQDKTVLGVTSKELISKGWPEKLSGSLKSIPAAYLTGLLIGKLAKSKFSEVIFDIGMHRNVKKSRIYAVLKGAIDSGLKIPHSSEALPEIKQINNVEVSKIFDKVKQSI